MRIMVPAIGALASVVVYLWRHDVKRHERTETKLDECEEHHEKTRGELLTLTEKVGRLEGRQEGIERLGNRVLEEIRKHVGDKGDGRNE